MNKLIQWRKEAGVRVEGSGPLDSGKVQAPCIVRDSAFGFRLFYTAVGPDRPFPICQGYILSAVSDDGLVFRKEPGIRIAPRPEVEHMALRVLAPSVTRCADGYWRMYFEARGSADRSTVIASAVSSDMLHWELDEGIRLETPGGVGAPRYVQLPDGRARLYCFNKEYGAGGLVNGQRLSQSVMSAVTSDGLRFELEEGFRMRDHQGNFDTAGITAAEVIPPEADGSPWVMVYSAWQDVPPGVVVPKHPSEVSQAVHDFAAMSIAADMAGYRSRIFIAESNDGMHWGEGRCVIEGGGYHAEGIDAVHAEDMSLVRLSQGSYRMYYAACDRRGNWRIASAVTLSP